MNPNFFRFTGQPGFEKSSLIAGWSRDSGDLSPSVIDYLAKKTVSEPFCDIEPAGFFKLEGVSVQKDVAQFPQCRFSCNQQKDLVLFKADEPQFEKYQFLNAVLDVAQQYCKTRLLYTVNGVMSLSAHTNRRRILAVFNQGDIREKFNGSELNNMTWQGPPAISSYLLWMAAGRGIAGVSLWTEIPFYLAAWQDYAAVKTTLSFLNKRLNLEVDLKDLDNQNSRQNSLLAQLRQENPDINRYVGILENGLSLNEDEQLQLISGVNDFLSRSN